MVVDRISIACGRDMPHAKMETFYSIAGLDSSPSSSSLLTFTLYTSTTHPGLESTKDAVRIVALQVRRRQVTAIVTQRQATVTATGSVSAMEPSFKPVEMSFPLPRQPHLTFHAHLSSFGNCAMVHLTTTSLESSDSGLPGLGSFVYAMPDVRERSILPTSHGPSDSEAKVSSADHRAGDQRSQCDEYHSDRLGVEHRLRH